MMNKETNSVVLDIVTHNIAMAIDSVNAVLSLLDDCGLDESDQDMVKESMLTCLQELHISYDKVTFADDEGERP